MSDPGVDPGEEPVDMPRTCPPPSESLSAGDDARDAVVCSAHAHRHHRGSSAVAIAQMPSGPMLLNSRFSTASAPPPGIHRRRALRSDALARRSRRFETDPGSLESDGDDDPNGAAFDPGITGNVPGEDAPDRDSGELLSAASTSTATGSIAAAMASAPSLPIALSLKSSTLSAVLNAHMDSSVALTLSLRLLRRGAIARAIACAPATPMELPPEVHLAHLRVEHPPSEADAAARARARGVSALDRTPRGARARVAVRGELARVPSRDAPHRLQRDADVARADVPETGPREVQNPQRAREDVRRRAANRRSPRRDDGRHRLAAFFSEEHVREVQRRERARERPGSVRVRARGISSPRSRAARLETNTSSCSRAGDETSG